MKNHTPNEFLPFLLRSIILCLLFILPNSIFSQDTRGLTPPKKANHTIGNSYVLSIGIDQYDNWLHLKNAVNDATAFSDIIKNDFAFQEITTPLYNDLASKTNIINTIKYELANKLKENDRLIIFFAGHGFTEKVMVDGKEVEKSYLVPVNAQAENETSRSNYLEMGEFLKAVSELPAFHISVFLDACNSGFALTDNIKNYRSGVGEIDFIETQKSRKVFTSAKSNQVALDEGPIKGNSLYTGLLVEGLKHKQADVNADKKINMMELAFFIQQRMNDFFPEMQSPDYGAFFLDERGEMVLRYDEANSKDVVTRAPSTPKKLSYTALSYRSYSDVENQDLGSWIAETVIDGLVESKNRASEFTVFNPDIVRRNDYSDQKSYATFIEKNAVDRLFTGSYIIDEENLIIKTQLINKEQKVIFTFPDVIGKVDNKQTLLNELKKRVVGFLATEEMSIAQINPPPNYDAFKMYRKANSFYGKDNDKMRFYLEKAINIDPNFFIAYIAKVRSYLEYTIDLAKAKEEVERIMNHDGFNLTEYQELQLELILPESIGDYETCADLYKELFELYQDLGSLDYALWYLSVCYRYTEVNELVEQNLSNPAFAKYIPGMVEYKLEYYLITDQHDEQYESYYNQLFEILKDKPKRGRLNILLRNKINYGCETEECIEELIQMCQTYAPKKLWNEYLRLGQYYKAEGYKKEAAIFYKKAWESGQEKELNRSMELELKCRNGAYKETAIWFDKNYKDVVKEDADLATLLTEIDVYSLACINLNRQPKNFKFLEEKILARKKYAFARYYTLGKLAYANQDENLALKYFEKAFSHGFSKSYGRYLHDATLQKFKSNKDFLAFGQWK